MSEKKAILEQLARGEISKEDAEEKLASQNAGRDAEMPPPPPQRTSNNGRLWILIIVIVAVIVGLLLFLLVPFFLFFVVAREQHSEFKQMSRVMAEQHQRFSEKVDRDFQEARRKSKPMGDALFQNVRKKSNSREDSIPTISVSAQPPETIIRVDGDPLSPEQEARLKQEIRKKLDSQRTKRQSE